MSPQFLWNVKAWLHPALLCTNRAESTWEQGLSASSPCCTQPTAGFRTNISGRLVPRVFLFLISLPPCFWERLDWQRLSLKIVLPLWRCQRKMSHLSWCYLAYCFGGKHLLQSIAVLIRNSSNSAGLPRRWIAGAELPCRTCSALTKIEEGSGEKEILWRQRCQLTFLSGSPS